MTRLSYYAIVRLRFANRTYMQVGSSRYKLQAPACLAYRN